MFQTGNETKEVSLDYILRQCRNLSSSDNLKLKDYWIVESSKSPNSMHSLCALKGPRMHLIIGQDGMFSSPSSQRSRTGLWAGETRHLSSISISDEDSKTLQLDKYVRGFGYIYRQYGSIERIDYITPEKALCLIALRSHEPFSLEFAFEVMHEKSWPSPSRAESYSSKVAPDSIRISSNLAVTEIGCVTAETASFSFSENTVRIAVKNQREVTLYISCDGSIPEPTDLSDTILFHESVKKRSILTTPSFAIDKLFLWAKHDLLELYSEIAENAGFFAGMPVFSWFFGRDGEWMSMAATECVDHSLSKKHLDLLYRFSDNGRIPHEIPALGSHEGDKTIRPIDRIRSETGFMSIDSSPLWVMTRLQLTAWTGEPDYMIGTDRVMDFILSCDKNSDALIENSFSKKLIGWPESWAEKRDGACIEINAWWIESLRMYSKITGRMKDTLELANRNFEKLFFNPEVEPPMVFDSVFNGKKRNIRNAMLVVPAMYESSDRMRKLLIDMGRPDMVTEWGLRSVSTEDPLFDGGYHTGMVWPLMTGWYTLALFKNGLRERAMAMLETFTKLAFKSSDPGRINEVYGADEPRPEGQFFQGWSSSLFIQAIVEGLFGIPFSPDEISDRTVKPNLPDSWDFMKLENVHFRKDSLYLTVDKSGAKVKKGLNPPQL